MLDRIGLRDLGPKAKHWDSKVIQCCRHKCCFSNPGINVLYRPRPSRMKILPSSLLIEV